MSYLPIIRAELRKLTSTKMPFAFLAVLTVIAATNAAAVIWGTDFDGSKTFVSTAEDQQSLMAFAANSLMIAGLFGAVASAREYGHNTIIPTFLAVPQRLKAVLAQLAAIGLGGVILGLVGAALTVAAVALALPTTEFDFLVSFGGVVRVLAASAFAGAAGAVLGAGIGSVVRNTGGAVTGAVLLLVIAPPLIIQLARDAISWVPNTLANVLSGVAEDVSAPAAVLAILAWAAVPAAIGLVTVLRSDIA